MLLSHCICRSQLPDYFFSTYSTVVPAVLVLFFLTLETGCEVSAVDPFLESEGLFLYENHTITKNTL